MAVDEQAEEIIGRLLDLFHRMRDGFEKAAADVGLTPAEAQALHRLDEPSPMRAMADALHCDASYITVLSDRLEALGLVERSADPGDRRVRQLALTREGRRARTRLISRIHQHSPAPGSLDASQRAELLDLLEQMAGPDGYRGFTCGS